MDEFPHQDREVVALYDVVGSFYVSTFYNNVYESARALMNAGKSRSITEAYQSQVEIYATYVKADKAAFRDSLHKLYEFVRQYNSRQIISSYSSLIDRIAKTVVPDNLYENLTSSDKDELCNLVVTQLICELAAMFTSPEVLHKIIDRGNSAEDKMVCKSLQIRGIRLLFDIRDEQLHKFISESTGSRGEGAHQETITRQQRAIKEMAAEISGLEEDLITARQREAKAETEKMRLLSIIYGLRQQISYPKPVGAPLSVAPPAVEPAMPAVEPAMSAVEPAMPVVESVTGADESVTGADEESGSTPPEKEQPADDPFSAWN